MTSFVVETFVPAGNGERFAVDVDGLRRAASASGGGVRHIRSYLVPGDEMGFHLVDAVTVDEVARLASRAGIEPERIVVAVRVDDDRAKATAADPETGARQAIGRPGPEGNPR